MMKKTILEKLKFRIELMKPGNRIRAVCIKKGSEFDIDGKIYVFNAEYYSEYFGSTKEYLKYCLLVSNMGWLKKHNIISIKKSGENK